MNFVNEVKLPDERLFYTEQNVLAFDNVEWNKKGDIGNNNQYYKEAVIVSIHKDVCFGTEETLVGVRFKHHANKDYISCGHFATALKLI